MNDVSEQMTSAMQELQQMLREDGSEVSLLSVDGPHITLNVKSALCFCTSSELELHQEIKGFLRAKIPDLESITVKTIK
jgi:Fe-S cluster biogenesis protein NfuA